MSRDNIGCPESDPVMAAAWAGCVAWAMGQPEFRKQFKEDTGQDLDSLAAAQGIDRMIDEASGRTKSVMFAWCEWVTSNLWGDR